MDVENTTLVSSATEGISFLPNKKNVTNAILVLNSVSMKNRGNFYCSGKNAVVYSAVSSGPAYVRIKGNNTKYLIIIYIIMFNQKFITFFYIYIDKMAALWPFLGICAEVIILCLIIFIYEKKRNKAEFEESDTDQGPET